ncbi:M15 family metallopeptidase [Bacillus sp. JCM 19041]|uniref:M15 family metallopeptidase n=1 Tax=Bacillus sp. JCM 19041 TaxID=1460637 RepID=UPI0006D0CDC4
MRHLLKLSLFLLLCLLILMGVYYFSERNGLPFEEAFTDSFTDAKLINNVEIDEIINSEGLHPIVEEKTEELIKQSSEVGIDIIITDGYRSIEEQDKLYKQGRQNSGQVVTNAKGGQSYHNFGLAVDYALLNENGEPIWDIHYDGNQNGEPDWFEVADIAKELGFQWGGDWSRFVDYPHLQMTFGYSIRELKQAARNSE